MSKVAEEIVHDIVDELTDYSSFANSYFKLDNSEQNVLKGKLVGIVDQNLERHESLKRVES